jgi:hypothetical protein
MAQYFYSEKNLNEIEIDLPALQADCRAAHPALAWDNYECYQRRWDYLQALPVFKQQGLPFDKYRMDKASLTVLHAQLTPLEINTLQQIQPRRRRAFGQLHAQVAAEKIDLLWDNKTTFQQSASSYYPASRTFSALGLSLRQSSALAAVIRYCLSMIHAVKQHSFHAILHIHHVQLFVDGPSPGDATPEGLHQDGADFIVPALLVNKHNILGFVSRLYEKNAHHPQFTCMSTRELQEGDFILQEDQHSFLYHDVSLGFRDALPTPGIRESIGIDIHMKG